MRKTVWLLVVLSALAALYGGLWYATAATVRTLTLQWLDDRRREGMIITHDTPVLNGFPFKAQAKIPNVVMAAPAVADSPAWAWRMDDLRAFARPFVFDRFFLDLAGTHTFSGPWPRDVQAEFKHADAAITTAGDSAEVTLAGVTAGAFTLESANIKMALSANTVHAEIAVNNATVTGVLPQPLSHTLQNLQLSVDVTGQLPTKIRLPEMLESWRASGGAIEVRALDVTWPPVSAKGSGTVALDSSLQPEGAFTATFTGFMDVVDMLVAAQRMDNQQASMARGALMLLSKTPNDGSAPYLDLSLTVQNRKVTAGPILLMEMPPVAWPHNIIVP